MGDGNKIADGDTADGMHHQTGGDTAAGMRIGNARIIFVQHDTTVVASRFVNSIDNSVENEVIVQSQPAKKV